MWRNPPRHLEASEIGQYKAAASHGICIAYIIPNLLLLGQQWQAKPLLIIP